MAINNFKNALMLLVALGVTSTAFAENPQPAIAQSKAYDTPFSNMVLLKWLLDDERTWCHVYMRRDAYEAAKNSNWVLPADAEIGQITCQQSRR